jgi:hypothetical protein
MKRVLITISRTYSRWDTVVRALARVADELHGEEIVLVHGDNPSGDRHVARIARNLFRWTLEPHPAQWRRNGVYNPQAGPLRNHEMTALGADVCLAFIDKGSAGASHCARIAEEAGIPVRRYET